MRLIIKDYLLQLKEKDELDLLLCDLLLQMGYITDNRPETGNRQYGVDIRAHNQREILLCVVKQKNIDRKLWDADQNAVRPSLNEIRDVYFRLMSEKDRKKKLRIAVVTNGVLDEAVRPNWEGYVEQNKNWEGTKVEIEFWNIDMLVDSVQKLLFDEHLFDTAMQSLLRKALYFVGEPDYRNAYFECIVDHYIDGMTGEESLKVFRKTMASLYMATQMIAVFAADVKVYKIGIMISEYLLIRYWKFLLEKKLLGKAKYAEWLQQFLASYEKWNQKYYEVIRPCCHEKNMLPFYHVEEQRVMLYEILGYLTSYAYYLSFKDKQSCQNVLNSIISLLNQNPQFVYAPYDQHVGVISMLYRLLDRMGRTDDINILLNSQCIQLMQYYWVSHKYPTATDSFQESVNIENGCPEEEYNTSGLWGTFLEWIVLMRQDELYRQLQKFLQEDLAEVTKCVWFLRAEEEPQFYDSYAMQRAGEGVAIDMEESYEKLEKKILFILEQYQGERFSFDEYSFPALEMMCCRYYGYLVRVKREAGIVGDN